MMRRLLLLTTTLLLLACHDRQSPMEEGNAVYYWRTELRLDSMERAFLEQYHINKVYCRYFDVVMRAPSDSLQGTTDSLAPMPNATITFRDTLPPGIEIIPTVFIVENCMHTKPEGMAKKLVQRIVQMNETNDIKGVKEIQIDCDYTSRSRKTYYDFLEEVRREAQAHGMRLSTTIRLHQLSMKVPPADYGVLMLYNTGRPDNFPERNPILDIRDVNPYLRWLGDYDLPLAAAYPVFLWERTIHGVHIEHVADEHEILQVKQAVERNRGELRRSIITYDLETDNINRYKPETYEKIYSH